VPQDPQTMKVLWGHMEMGLEVVHVPVVPDLGSVRPELLGRGPDISEIHDMGGVQFAYFGDPDGNSRVL